MPLVDETFWLLSLDSVAVNGTTSTSAASRAAVDTGTTLVGGPTEVVDALYRSIPGAEALSGDFAGCAFVSLCAVRKADRRSHRLRLPL